MHLETCRRYINTTIVCICLHACVLWIRSMLEASVSFPAHLASSLTRPGQARAQGAQGPQEQEGHWGWFSVGTSVILRRLKALAALIQRDAGKLILFWRVVFAGRSLTKNLDEESMESRHHTSCIELQHYGVHSGVSGQWVEEVLTSSTSYFFYIPRFPRTGVPLVFIRLDNGRFSISSIHFGAKPHPSLGAVCGPLAECKDSFAVCRGRKLAGRLWNHEHCSPRDLEPQKQ